MIYPVDSVIYTVPFEQPGPVANWIIRSRYLCVIVAPSLTITRQKSWARHLVVKYLHRYQKAIYLWIQPTHSAKHSDVKEKADSSCWSRLRWRMVRLLCTNSSCPASKIHRPQLLLVAIKYTSHSFLNRNIVFPRRLNTLTFLSI